LMFAPHDPEGPQENRPRRVKNPAETEPSPLDLNSINQRKIRPTSPRTPGRGNWHRFLARC